MPNDRCEICKAWDVIEEPDEYVVHPGYWTLDTPPVWVPEWTETVNQTGRKGRCKIGPAIYTGAGDDSWQQSVMVKQGKCSQFVEDD